MPAFQTPQFPLAPDETKAPRMFGNVSNIMEVASGSRTHRVYVAVPTGLFVLMKDVFKASPDVTYELAIDRDGERFILSLYGEKTDSLWDLWSYSRGAIPTWVWSTTYRVR